MARSSMDWQPTNAEVFYQHEPTPRSRPQGVKRDLYGRVLPQEKYDISPVDYMPGGWPFSPPKTDNLFGRPAMEDQDVFDIATAPAKRLCRGVTTAAAQLTNTIREALDELVADVVEQLPIKAAHAAQIKAAAVACNSIHPIRTAVAAHNPMDQIRATAARVASHDPMSRVRATATRVASYNPITPVFVILRQLRAAQTERRHKSRRRSPTPRRRSTTPPPAVDYAYYSDSDEESEISVSSAALAAIELKPLQHSVPKQYRRLGFLGGNKRWDTTPFTETVASHLKSIPPVIVSPSTPTSDSRVPPKVPKTPQSDAQDSPQSPSTSDSHDHPKLPITPSSDARDTVHLSPNRAATLVAPATPDVTTPKSTDLSDRKNRVRETRTITRALKEARDAKNYEIKPLSKEWDDKVNMALRNGHGAYTTHDLHKVVPPRSSGGINAWLNDETINGYLKLICDHGNKDVKPGQTVRFHAFNSFFYSTLASKGYDGVKRWAKKAKIDGKRILNMDQIFVPINSGAHWTLCVVSPKQNQIVHYNSLGSSGGNRYVENVKHWLEAELGSAFNEDTWVLNPKGESPQQNNMSDCGVFTITSAKEIMLGNVPKYSANQIQTQRRRIVAELINGALIQN